MENPFGDGNLVVPSGIFFFEFSHSLLIEVVYMNKKYIGLICIAVCIFFFTMLRNLGCPAEAEDSPDQPSSFQATLTLDSTKRNPSMFEPCGPGSGGGRGPGPMEKLAGSRQIT